MRMKSKIKFCPRELERETSSLRTKKKNVNFFRGWQDVWFIRALRCPSFSCVAAAEADTGLRFKHQCHPWPSRQTLHLTVELAPGCFLGDLFLITEVRFLKARTLEFSLPNLATKTSTLQSSWRPGVYTFKKVKVMYTVLWPDRKRLPPLLKGAGIN